MHLLRQPAPALILGALALGSGARAQETRELQQQLMLRELEVERVRAEADRLREQLARTEAEAAEAEARVDEAEARLRALGTASLEGEDAVAARLVEAIGAAVELNQRGEEFRSAAEAAIENLTLALGRGDLAEPDQVAVQDAIGQIRAGLAAWSRPATVAGEGELVVAEYDAGLRLAILRHGTDQGLRPGLRLATAGENPQQLLVVEARPHLAGAVQLDPDAQPLVEGENLQPVLERSRN